MSSLPVDVRLLRSPACLRLSATGVAMVPGTAFGLAPYIRLAYALSDADLKAACEQILAACKRLVPA